MAFTLRHGSSNQDATARVLARLLIVASLAVPNGACGGELGSTPTPARDDDAGGGAVSTNADAARAISDATEAVPSPDAGTAPLCRPVTPDAGWGFCSLGRDYYVCDVMFEDYPPGLEGPCAPEGIECGNGCAAVCNCVNGEWACFLPPCFK